MSKIDTTNEIATLLRARYPIIYLVTYEEKRARELLRDICADRQLDMYIWSFTDGYKKDNTADKPTAADPLKILDVIRTHNSAAAFVLRDMHPYFAAPDVIRKIRDILEDHSDARHYKPIIITSPILKIPPELEKAITVVDLTLPDNDEIAEHVDAGIDLIQRRSDTPMALDIREKVIKACTGLTTEEIGNVLSKSIVQTRTLDVPTILSEKKQIIRKGGILEYYDNCEKYSDVGGLDVLKHWFEDRTDAFSDKAKAFGLPSPKGTLLLGIPGTGKSLIAKAMAGLWGVPLVRMDVGKIFAGIVGASEENMRRAIATVEAVAPVVLFIDEIEKGLSGTGSSNMSDAGTAARVFGTFLSWLNDKESPVFVVATANNVRELPPELLRKGRFDEIWFTDLPMSVERAAIFSIHICKARAGHQGRAIEGFDIEALAAISEGFSGAEIEQAVIAGLFKAFKADTPLAQTHVEEAIKETVPLSKTMSEQINALRSWVASGKARYASSGIHTDVQVPVSPMSQLSLPKIRIRRGK